MNQSEPGLSLDNLFLSFILPTSATLVSRWGSPSVRVLIFCLVGLIGRDQLVVLDWFTDQLFTGTGYCSERSDVRRSYCVSGCSLLFPFPHGWLTSPTFGRVPVSAVSGTGAASLPEQLKNGMPAPCQRYWTGIQPECSAPIHFFWNKVGLKMCFFTSYTELARTGVQGALPDVRSGGGPVPSQYLFS
ncbi:hypothetical protein J6590_020538 [Homalodisca vitripennis]|nr:hypothetical protein J6590_020538 [Homalodisca vitripennis]